MIRSAMSQGRTLPDFQLSTPDIRFICNISACSSIKGTDEHVLLVSGVITLPTPPHLKAPN